MKNLSFKFSSVLFFIFFFLVFFSANDLLARDNVNYWYIKDYQMQVEVKEDNRLEVKETILADCGSCLGKHGIFRILPTDYKTQEFVYPLSTKIISVTDEKGSPLKYQKTKSSDTITLKIGDPGVEVQGENYYVIKYEVENVIRTEREEADELYYNLLGNFWDLEIDNFRAQVVFPEEINEANTEIYLYSGQLGENNNSFVDYSWESSNTLNVSSNAVLRRGQGITVSASFPKGLITNKSIREERKEGAEKILGLITQKPDNRGSFGGVVLNFLIPILLAIGAFLMWFKYGKDPKVNRPVVAEFEPPQNLSPLPMGSILKEAGLHKNAVTATIIYLAVNGYLKIETIEAKGWLSQKDYKFIRTDKKAHELYEHDKFILDKLFDDKNEVKLSKLKYKFGKKIRMLSLNVSSDLIKRGFIEKKSNGRRYIMLVIGSMLIYFSLYFGGIKYILMSIVFLFFAFFMRKLTKEGAELKRQIKGFELYMKTAEKYRSRFYEKEGMMEKLLPYAILFGLTKEWLKKMKEIYGEEYFNNYSPAFMAGAVAMSDFSNFEAVINDISKSVSANVSSGSSGAGGGGSVGGGAGGGGGGGW